MVFSQGQKYLAQESLLEDWRGLGGQRSDKVDQSNIWKDLMRHIFKSVLYPYSPLLHGSTAIQLLLVPSQLCAIALTLQRSSNLSSNLINLSN
jgi:hypothetical protein